jgi:hypothetical protein
VLLVFHRRSDREYLELRRLIMEQARESKFRVHEELETMAESMAQLLERQGYERGEARTMRRLLEKALRERFGKLPAELVRTLDQASPAEMETWFERALRAATLAEVGING